MDFNLTEVDTDAVATGDSDPAGNSSAPADFFAYVFEPRSWLGPSPSTLLVVCMWLLVHLVGTPLTAGLILYEMQGSLNYQVRIYSQNATTD